MKSVSVNSALFSLKGPTWGSIPNINNSHPQNQCGSVGRDDDTVQQGVYPLVWGFPGGLGVKVSAWNVRGLGSIPWRRKWQPTPVLLPGESHGGRSLVGYSPWGRKESDLTEWLHFLVIIQAQLEKW